jgi:excinuclease ABC subunit A
MDQECLVRRARFFAWLETKAYKMHIRVLLSRYRSYTECSACHGARLKPDALLWRVGKPGINIRELMLLPSTTAAASSPLKLPAPLDEATDLLLREIRARLKYLTDVGLGYLNLDRQSRTCPAAKCSASISPRRSAPRWSTPCSCWMSPRSACIRAMSIAHRRRHARLRDAGNTLVVVEHDPKVMQAADRVLDIGPGPGEHGGEIVFFGPLARELARQGIAHRRLSVRPQARRDTARAAGARGAAALAPFLRLEGATEHNLKNIDVEHSAAAPGVRDRRQRLRQIHAGARRAVSGAAARQGQAHGKSRPAPRLEGAELIDDVVMVDQSRIGRTTRSNPASYVGAFDAIRDLFAKPQARERKYTAGTFSFNAGNGRCPACGGNGFEHVEMQFLSDVYLRCPDCDGRRFRAEVLEVKLSRAGARPRASPMCSI